LLTFHRIKVLRRLAHPDRPFTQGFIVENGTVWESIGNYGQSAIRSYQLGRDQVDNATPLPDTLFAEGICLVGEHLWQLTWQERTALRWDRRSLALLDTVSYNREGWGICNAGSCVVTSDGSSELVRRDPKTLAPLGVVLVHCGGRRVTGLNDLEWAGGLVWANIAGRPYLAGIDLASGDVADIVDARPATEPQRGNLQKILNGISAMPEPGQFLLTGKYWRFIYHVQLTEARVPREPEFLVAG
jgi:glutaminyl-peptide cyclotransferase